MILRTGRVLGVLSLAAGLASCAGTESVSREELVLSVTATVEALDLPNRTVTLRGPAGGVLICRAGEEVKRLNEIRVGDRITAEYIVCLAGELREATEEEKKSPLLIVDEKGRAGSDSLPAGGVRRMIRVVATLEALDRSTRTVTLKGPRGLEVGIRVQDPSLLERVRLGQTVLVTYMEAVILKVEPRKE